MKRFIALALTLCMILSVSLTAIPAFAADDWHAGWHRAGTTTTDGKALTITAEGGVSSYITLSNPPNIGDQFDVEFTLQMKTFGNQNVQIFTGKHRLFFGVNETAVINSAPNGSVAASTFPFNVGYKPHTYRVIGNNGQAEFYADGFYIGKGPLEVRDGSKQIHIWNTSSATQSSEMVLTNVVARPYTGSLADQPEEDVQEENVADEPSPEVFCDFNDPNDRHGFGGTWSIQDGKFIAMNYEEKYISSSRPVPVKEGENFRIEIYAKFHGFSHGQGIQLSWPNYWLQMPMTANSIGFSSSGGDSSLTNLNWLDDQWHNILIETYDHAEKVRFYLDDKLLFDVPAQPNSRETFLYFYTYSLGGTLSGWEIDWLRITPYTHELSMTQPLRKATYLEGKEIPLEMVVDDPALDVPSVEYVIDGQVVATGVAPDYKASLKGLRAGKYEISARYEGSSSRPVSFTVIPKIDGELLATEKGDRLTVSLDLFDKGLANVIEVEYLLDGNSIGKTNEAPYTVTATDVYPERHNLMAVCRDEAGMVLTALTRQLEPKVGLEGEVSTNYANDITYTVSGDSGSATVDFSNGTHRVYLVHTPNGVTYLTDTGEETCSVGTGNFEIIADGSVADVYRNGQMVFSYYMPMTDQIDREIRQDGMKVENYKESAPVQKKNYFVKRNVKDKNTTYTLGETPSYINLDFVANKDDEAQLVLNDGYFQADVTLKDGKFSIWTTADDNGEPFEKVLAEAMDGKVYYRVEMSLGMCRLYGNGRWLTSFRAIHSGGKGSVTLDVQKGSLDYVGVNDNKDLRIFNDMFDGSGDLTSDKFYAVTKAGAIAEPEHGRLVVLAEDTQNAIVEWNAFAANFDFGANVNIQKCTGGFWFILNHSVTGSYSKIGYNFEKKQYEFVEVVNGAETVTKTVPGTLPVGEDIYLSLSSERLATGKQVVMYLNGNPVISVDDAAHRQGTFGFIINNGKGYVYDVDYRGDAKMVQGMKDIPSSTGANTADMMIDGDRMIYTLEAGVRSVSDDGGWTWQRIEGVAGDGQNMAQLSTGEIVSLVRKTVGIDENGIATHTYYSYISRDNGKSWEEQGPVMDPKPYRLTMQNRVTQGASGRIYFASCESNDESRGWTAIYYSDDKGKSWKKSKTEMRSDGGADMLIHEVVCLETNSGVVRAYFRNNLGFIHYFNSYDHGETWDLTPHPTPFFSSLNCFNIERDPETGYLYIAWGYDNAGLGGSGQLPRTRWSVAMSRDDGVTWEFVGTGHEHNESISSFIMNMNINVTPKYLVLSAMSIDDGTAWTCRNITMDKNQVASKRFDQLHYIADNAQESSNILQKDVQENLLLIDPETDTVLVHNWPVKGVVAGDKIALDCVAFYTGAMMSQDKDGNSILQKGEATITFTKDEISEKDGRNYVSLDMLAEKCSLYVTEYKGIYIVGKENRWSDAQLQFLRDTIAPAEEG